MIAPEAANIKACMLGHLISSIVTAKRSTSHRQRPSVREKRVNCLLAICLSICLHLAMLNLILWSRNDAIGGMPSPAPDGALLGASADMAPVNLILVSPRTAEILRAPEASPYGKRTSETDANTSQAASHASSDQPNTEIAKDTIKTQPAATSAKESNSLATTALAANGAVAGTSDIISQIARCLPAGQHPRLSARLNLAIDEKGQLTLVPSLDMDLEKSSPDEIRSANMIIQATLQCGPYPVPAQKNVAYSFVADFP